MKGVGWAIVPDAIHAWCEGRGWGIFETGGGTHPPFEVQSIDAPDDGERDLGAEFGDERERAAWSDLLAGAFCFDPGALATVAFLMEESPYELQWICHDRCGADEPPPLTIEEE